MKVYFYCFNRAEKTSILSDLIRKTNAQEMKWIIMIILKGVVIFCQCLNCRISFHAQWCQFSIDLRLHLSDLKLGISEKSIFHEFHPDAEDLFNVTCDLKLVCEKLRDRSQRHKRQVCFKFSYWTLWHTSFPDSVLLLDMLFHQIFLKYKFNCKISSFFLTLVTKCIFLTYNLVDICSPLAVGKDPKVTSWPRDEQMCYFLS